MKENGKDHSLEKEYIPDIDLYSIYEHLREYIIVLRARWLLLIICGGVVGSLFFLKALNNPTIHTAKTTFHTDSDGPGSGVDFSDPASILSYSLNGYVPANSQLVGVLTSRRISDEVVEDTVLFKGEPRMLADAMLEVARSSFSIKRTIVGLFTPSKGELSSASKIAICSKTLRRNLEILTDEHGFVLMKFSFGDKSLVRQISYLLVEELKAYFTLQKTEKALANLTFFQKRADSVRLEIEKLQFDIGSFYNQNKYSTNLIDQMHIKQLEAQNKFLNTIYTDIALQLERTRAQLQRETPIIHVLDLPEPPYQKSSSSSIVYFIIGATLGVLMISGYLLRKKLMRDLENIITFYMDNYQNKGRSTSSDA